MAITTNSSTSVKPPEAVSRQLGLGESSIVASDFGEGVCSGLAVTARERTKGPKEQKTAKSR